MRVRVGSGRGIAAAAGVALIVACAAASPDCGLNACAVKIALSALCRFRLPFAAVIPARASFDAGRVFDIACDR